MRVITKESTMFFDVDDTLIIWDVKPEDTDLVVVEDPNGKSITLKVHRPHLTLLKYHYARGSHVVVWSQGGYAWAASIVKALGIQRYVHQCMTKPRAYVDDLPAMKWMGDHINLDSNSKWGNNGL
jgi:phosphoserine phosphatase